MEQRVGRYQLKKRLAAGGMGEVYLAAQEGPEGFAKVVALKRMLPSMAAERELVKLFLHEARLVARLSHRGIAQVIELGEDKEGYFAALEFVPGPSVAVLIDRLAESKQRLPPALAIEIAAHVAEALGYAHHANNLDGTPLHIVHRDVSPQNILLSVTGDVKLIDFGVAKSTARQHATNDGGVKGKLAYMSPEQARGEKLDGRSDLFSLGLVLYEMLSGESPFARPDPLQTLMAIQSEPVPQLLRKDAKLGMCDALFRKLLAKNPAERFATGQELHDALLVLKARFPPPPKRLGNFVEQWFGREFSELTRSLSPVGPVLPLMDVVAEPPAAEPLPPPPEPTHEELFGSTQVRAGQPTPQPPSDPFSVALSAPAAFDEVSGTADTAPRRPVAAPPGMSPRSPTAARASGGAALPSQGPSRGAPNGTPSGPPSQSVGATVAAEPYDPRRSIRASVMRSEVYVTPPPPRRMNPALAVLIWVTILGSIGGAVAGFRYVRRVEMAIDDIANASPAERNARLSSVRKMIAAEHNPAKADYYRGRLEMVQGRPAMAANYYRSAAAAGISAAVGQLVDMLAAEDCDARQSAAEAVAELKLEEGRSRLERLAGTGGSGDSGAPIVGGCDSRRAAVDALRKLKRP